MKVLVTGDRGYIGCVLVPYLCRQGHDISGLDTDYYAHCDFTASSEDYPRIVADIRDVSEDVLKGFDAVVHLAALSNDPLGDLRSQWTYDINRDGSFRLARLAKSAGVARFVYASSCSMYGAAGSEALDEQAPFNPVTAYATSKVQAEQVISELADDSFSPTFMRNATAYGESPRLRLDIVLNNLVGWAVAIGKIRLLSDGTPWRPMVHVEDIAQAVAVVLDAPRDAVHNEAFNVGLNAENYQVRDLATIVAGVVPHCEIEMSPQAGADVRTYRVAFDKLRCRFPQFRSCWTVQKGAEQLYKAYSAAGLTRQDLEGRRFTRVKHLEHLLETTRLDETLRWTAQGAQ